MSKRVLLTGASGFVGKHLKSFLKEYTDLDIVCHAENLQRDLKYRKPFDYIVNLASDSSVERSIKYPAITIDNNIAIMLNLLEFARKHPPKVFLHFSTVEVYNVTNPYAASKAAQEEIANAYWKTYDVPVIIARSSNIVGEGQSRNKFVPKVISQIKQGKTVSLYEVEGAQGSRIYNPVQNVCSAILWLLTDDKKLRATKDFPIHYDIDGGDELTNLEMAELISVILDKKLKFKFIEPKDVRPAYATHLVTTGVKLTKTGWKPPIKLQESLSWIK